MVDVAANEVVNYRLLALLLVPIIGGIFAWVSSRSSALSSRWITIVTISISLLIALSFVGTDSTSYSVPWFERFRIHFSLTLDGLSLLLLILTLALGLLCVFVSWTEINEKVGFFHFSLLFCLAGINGVFLASDLFLFFFFWEVMLIPMTALILVWGHENKRYAAIKFFIFTQASSLLMLLSIIALALMHQKQVGQLSFDFEQLAQLQHSPVMEYLLMLGFFIAFAVKLPAVPFHTWLPDAHTQAPTAGSVLLAGILLKTGAYGLIRLILPLFPNATIEFAPIAVTLGVVSILYGAMMAYSQSDFKRLVAYSSISHMGFVLLAVFSWNTIALNGAIMTMVAHGISSAALFSMAGLIQLRLHSRELSHMGGMWVSAPKMGVMTLAFVAAGVGLPGLANFVGEFLSLMGSYQKFPVFTIIAALGLVGSAIYGLKLFQTAFQGPANNPTTDLTAREFSYTMVLFLALIYFGMNPGVVLEFTENTVKELVTNGQLLSGGNNVVR